jgi:hypothetical protein
MLRKTITPNTSAWDSIMGSASFFESALAAPDRELAEQIFFPTELVAGLPT